MIFNQLGAIDQKFEVENSNGITEYWIEINLRNGTPVPWVGFTWELGWNWGQPFFRHHALSGEGLDFDTPNRDPTPSHFAPFFPRLVP
jgi:hypothetical protein